LAAIVNITKHFLFITDGEAKAVKMYVLMMFFQDSSTFLSKAGAYLSGAHYSVHTYWNRSQLSKDNSYVWSVFAGQTD
jgi:hypothetical protein